MSDRVNEEVAKRFFLSMIEGDQDTALAMITEGFEFCLVPKSLGKEPEYGAAAIKSKLEGRKGLFEGKLKAEITRLACDGDTVVLEVNIIGKTTKGKIYDNWYIHWFELKDGKIALWRQHVDTKYAIDILM